MLAKHLFVSDSDGSLYDTLVPNWHNYPPLRKNYCRTHREIKSVVDLKSTLRNGAYAWPGGYPMAILLSDGEWISFATARSEFRQLVAALRDYRTNKYESSGWRPIGCDILYSGEVYDCHTGERLETAYGDSDDIAEETEV